MANGEGELLACERCGATIYPEHLEAHKADKFGGKLLCPHCLNEETQSPKATDEDAPPIQLVGEGDVAPAAASPRELKQFGGGGITFDNPMEKTSFRRSLLPESRNATRCRTFHTKLTDGALTHLNDVINEWVDENEDVQIKFVSTDIGIVEGKHADQHLIVTVFY